MANSKFKLILASTSPRRKELVGHLKVPFEIMTENVLEESHETDPVKFSEAIAIEKGEAVFNRVTKENSSGSYFVLSADTIVCLNGKIYGKPKDRSEAETFLRELAGRSHSVYTAVAIHALHDGKKTKHSFVEETKVTFNQISNVLMERYLATGDSLDKAGAYGIQGGSLTFISKVEGDYSNVVGFPLSRFVIEMEQFLKSNFPGRNSWADYF